MCHTNEACFRSWKTCSTHVEALSGHQQCTDQGSSRHMEPTTTDRISGLPESILQDILSFLPAPEVVRTSILSSRWREVWTSVPCLHVDANDEFEEDDDRFINFVSCLLQGRAEDAPLREFYIYSPRSAKANSWISYALDHQVESLEFSDEFFDVMEMEPFILDTRIANFSSSHLRRLVLYNVALDAIHFSQLNDHCPKLQILELEESHLDTFGISSSSLMSLQIKDCTTRGDMLICAPKLTLLSFINSGNRVVSLEAIPSLVKAIVILYFNIFSSADDDQWEVMDNTEYSIIQGLCHAKSIEVNVPIKEPVVLENELSRGQLFSNLTSLTLGEWCMADLYPVAWFLQQAPLLENLNIRLRPIRRKEYEPTHFPRERLFRAACLNNVTIVCHTTDPMVQELLKLLLFAAKSSLKININPGSKATITAPKLSE